MAIEGVEQKQTHAIKSFFALVGSIFLRTFIATLSAILSALIVGASSIWIWTWSFDINIKNTIKKNIVNVINHTLTNNEVNESLTEIIHSLTKIITSQTFNENFTQIINAELGTVVKEELSSEHLSEKLKELEEFKELQKLKTEFNELKNLADTGSLGEYLPFILAIRHNDEDRDPAFKKLKKFNLIDFLDLMKAVKKGELAVEKMVK